MTTLVGLVVVVTPSVWLVAVCREVRRASVCRLLREKALR